MAMTCCFVTKGIWLGCQFCWSICSTYPFISNKLMQSFCYLSAAISWPEKLGLLHLYLCHFFKTTDNIVAAANFRITAAVGKSQSDLMIANGTVTQVWKKPITCVCS